MRSVHPLHPKPADSLAQIAADMDTILCDIALEHPDLEPGYHAAIRLVRDRYRDWLTDNHQPIGDDAS